MRLFCLYWIWLAAGLTATHAQVTAALPETPLPVARWGSGVAPFIAASGGAEAEAKPGESGPQDQTSPEAQPAGDTQLTMFPHSETARYWISGQSNTIFQGKPGFHSPYQGANSLDNAGEYKTSLVETLYLGWQPHRNRRYNTDLLLDVESAGGRGIGQALGLAGFTNLDVVRNPNLGTAPYLGRGEIHQTIGLTSEMTESDRNQFSLATQVPVRRFEVRVGKMGANDFMDVNEVATDSHLQFLNWTVDDNGAWDYAADTRGYTVGGLLEYDDRTWSARYGIFAMPTVANGLALDWALSRAHGQNWEFEWRHSLIRGRKGTTKLLGFANDAHMGNYRLAVQHFFDGVTPTPEITSVERFGAVKYGMSWNNEQDITDNLRIGTRFGWNDDQEESYAYTEVGQSVVIAGDYAGTRWHRPADRVGTAFVSNAIKRDHQNYLKYGGLGFLLGDGHLNYGRENIVESYYTWHAWRGLFMALDAQHIDDPGYNRDRGPVWVGAMRGHIDF
ncbi:MAG: carbohydrate porin [Acidobacteriota bacterium]